MPRDSAYGDEVDMGPDDPRPTGPRPGGRRAQGDQERWRTVRRFLNGNRHPLTAVAAGLYPSSLRVADTPLLSATGWVPDRAVPLEETAVAWAVGTAPGELTGAEPVTGTLRAAQAPARGSVRSGRAESGRAESGRAESGRAGCAPGPSPASAQPFATYAQALAALDPPRLLENRTTYRLVNVHAPVAGDPSPVPGHRARPGKSTIRLAFARGSYFDVVNICEAAAHELAAAVLDQLGDSQPGDDRAGPLPAVGWQDLPWRRLIGDPCDATRRPLLPAISTLLLRRDPASGQASFPLHWRDPAKVASGGGLYQVVPVGMFQPSSDAAWNELNDLDLWRATVRELSEELLGTSECYGTATAPLDYESWPFYRALADARRRGSLRVFWLGTGIDPLTLVVDMLQVAVFDADVFDTLFAGFVMANAEGHVIGTRADSTGAIQGIPFTAESVGRYAGAEPMQPAGAALLRLAWQHRHTLLG